MTTLGSFGIRRRAQKKSNHVEVGGERLVVVVVGVFATMKVVVCALAGLHLDRFKRPGSAVEYFDSRGP